MVRKVHCEIALAFNFWYFFPYFETRTQFSISYTLIFHSLILRGHKVHKSLEKNTSFFLTNKFS